MKKNILSNTNIKNFLPKNNYLKYIFLIFGFLSPWPIFIDLRNLSIIFLEFTPGEYVDKLDSLPVPIGFFSLSFYILFLMIRTKSFIYLVRSMSLYCLILTPILIGFDFNRIPVLITPILFLIILKRLVRIKYVPNDGFVIGFLFGLLALYFSNIISFLTLSFFDQEFLDLGYANQFFGFEIWQYFLSYPAIASLVSGLSILYLKDNFKVLSNFKIFLVLLTTFSLLAATLTLRRASFLDFFILNLIILKDFFIKLRFTKISKFNLFVFFITSIGFLFSRNIISSSRTGSFSVGPRVSILSNFFSDLSNIDIFSFLFGIDRGTIGGYGSLLLELFIRNGIIGLIFYFLILGYCFYSFFKNLFSIPNLPKSNNMDLILFTLSSAIIGNLININFAVPYYSINYACILIVIYSIDITSRLRRL